MKQLRKVTSINIATLSVSIAVLLAANHETVTANSNRVPIFSVAVAGENMGGASNIGFSLASGFLKQSVSSNEPIILDLQIKNITSQDRDFPDPMGRFDITVTNPRGLTARLTDYGHLVMSQPSVGLIRMNTGIGIKAQGTYHFYVYLNRIYDMTLNGDYTVSVKQKILGIDGKNMVELKSNPMTVHILPISDQAVAVEELKANHMDAAAVAIQNF